MHGDCSLYSLAGFAFGGVFGALFGSYLTFCHLDRNRDVAP